MKKLYVLLFLSMVFFTIPALAESATTKLLDSMAAFGAPIDPESYVDYTSETDPNGRLGQDGYYTSKTDFTVNGSACTIEGFDAVVDAYSRFGYIKGVYTSYPNTIQNMYLRDLYVIRLDANTDPYELQSVIDAFEAVLPDSEKTVSYTVDPVVEDQSLVEMLNASGMVVDTSDIDSDINLMIWMSSDGFEFLHIEYNRKQYDVSSYTNSDDMYMLFNRLIKSYDFNLLLYSNDLDASVATASYMPTGWNASISNENFTDKSLFLEYIDSLISQLSIPTVRPSPTTHNGNTSAITSLINNKLPSYTGVELQKIRYNPNASTDDPDDIIVLVDFTWNVPNSKSTTKSMLTMYADDLAATIAEDFSHVSEIAIFWDVPYLNLNAKNSYECSDGKAYIADVVY